MNPANNGFVCSGKQSCHEQHAHQLLLVLSACEEAYGLFEKNCLLLLGKRRLLT